ncbi:MAG: response regulator [Oscillospiraceae bacterium]
MDVVYNGQDALDYGLAENYDCLVLDIMMPKLDGIQVLRSSAAEKHFHPRAAAHGQKPGRGPDRRAQQRG